MAGTLLQPVARRATAVAAAVAIALAALMASAAGAGEDAGQTDDTGAAIARYHEMLDEANPAELDQMRGEQLWKTARGPAHATLERCDLGRGPGVVDGAYAGLPRLFADTGRVQDLESRLITCITTLQGIAKSEVVAQPFSTDAARSDIEALVAYVAGRSRGAVMSVPLQDPKERRAYALGERLFHYRAGPYDFSCASCHSEDGRRIRLQELPNLTTRAGARRAYTTWPAYRVSQGLFRSFQWRLNDCFRQQRFPEPAYASEATIALTMFIAANANGAVYAGPGIKR
ncbi:MAG TPA: sulfur oxidation c-type cytochrome SoxA [Burkholderiaceae bacterium]